MLLILLAIAAHLASGCQGVDPTNASTGSLTTQVRIAAVGTDSGNRTGYQLIAERDLAGSITHLDASEFNRLSMQELRARFDVLLITWATTSKLNVDFQDRLLPFLELGGGVVFEDPGNATDLAPAVLVAPRFPFQGLFTIESVPGLTDGVVTEFPHNHMAFAQWDARFGPLLRVNGLAVSLYGGFPGGGRMVITGTDQHFHGDKHSPRAYERNQYTFLRNELCWAGGCVNAPPIARAGGDRDIECTGPLTRVALDGSNSFDTDRDVLTYQWTGAFESTVTGDPMATATLPPGSHAIRLTVADGHGGNSTDQATLRVVDTGLPVIDLRVDATGRWAPDHKMVRLVTVFASDACDHSPSVRISVSSDEPVNDTGDGNTEPDWRVETLTDGARAVWLRAERSGSGEGRRYVVTVTASDDSGNSATRVASILVPHSR
ncbi:MAG TPA: PKD domain-containing protein [Myxococcaceae bacterium]|nr:PKD domain-containing protein [Myxococcaceae bacterium]